ncbi:hypothetical protein BHE74_00041727 [Ensete ventricosum]|nr:hypothetical protein GW17_00010748 [Ensete ventricosum]RWW51886.1 hypothetical protein BHE74_00041727 [Ensete ventricosum]
MHLVGTVNVIAEHLSEDEIAGLKEMFKMIDTDNSGHITFEELKAGLERVGARLKESEVYALMQADGHIDYNEFVAMMQNGNNGFGKKGMQTTFSMGFREALKLG